MEYSFPMLFDDRLLNIYAYNPGTVMAEKLETVLSRGIANTRTRDFYDIHILYSLRGDTCDIGVLHEALTRTAGKRGSIEIMDRYESIIDQIQGSGQMRNFWEKLSAEF